jgi:putative transcriptional regulator
MNRIKEILKEKGVKQVWLAEKLGKSYNMVNGYVTNKRQPSIVTLYEIAKLLEVDAKELLN